jgi:spermidine synthase
MANPSTGGSAGDRLRLLAYPLFFASGMAGLIYEVVWTRLLLYVFGAGIYAVSAVLAAFMAGLALGSFALGRASDRLEKPLRLYAILEAGIGVAGIALPFILRRISVVDAWAYERWGQDFALLTACRFVVTFLLLMVPTTMMGATLPVMSKAMIRSGKRLGLHVGELYSINTAGAVGGVFIAGFYLIGRFGVMNTVFMAAALNGLVAVLAFVLSSRAERGKIEVEPTPVAPKVEADAKALLPLEPSQVRLILCAAFVTGIVSLSAQVLWSRSLVFMFEYLKSTTYAFSAMLTVFLTGLALGSFLIGLVVDRTRNPMRLYGLLIVLLGASMAFSVYVLRSGAGLLLIGNPFNPETQAFIWPMAVVNIMLQTISVLGIPTLLMGMAFPVAARAVVSTGRIATDTGKLYALNTAGAIVGSVAAAFLLVPMFGLTKGLFVLAGIDLVMGIMLVLGSPLGRGQVAAGGLVGAGLVGVMIWMLPNELGMQILDPTENMVYYHEGPTATVSVTENSLGYRTIYVDGAGVAGTEPMIQTDQKSLAHMPMFLVKDPKAALTVGFGSGGASYSYLLHDRLEQVHCVEICREVPLAAPHLTDANHGFLEKGDPRYKIIIDDARTYLQYTEQTYDIIATDCTDLRYKSNANLYDLEYFTYARERLRPGGAVVVWMPLGGLSDEVYRIALRTFYKVFPEMAVFFMNNEPTHYVLLVGWRDKMEFDYRWFVERLKEDDVHADLAALQLGEPMKLLSTWILGGEPLAEYLAGDELNTENDPLIEFRSPKYGYQDQAVLDNLDAMLRFGNDPDPWIVPGSMTPREEEALDRHMAAAKHIIEGHAKYRHIDIEGAARSYLAALELTPEDVSLPYLLDMRELALRAENGDYWSHYMLGRVEQLRGNRRAALDRWTNARRLMQGMPATPFMQGVTRNMEKWQAELERERAQERVGAVTLQQ